MTDMSVAESIIEQFHLFSKVFMHRVITLERDTHDTFSLRERLDSRGNRARECDLVTVKHSEDGQTIDLSLNGDDFYGREEHGRLYRFHSPFYFNDSSLNKAFSLMSKALRNAGFDDVKEGGMAHDYLGEMRAVPQISIFKPSIYLTVPVIEETVRKMGQAVIQGRCVLAYDILYKAELEVLDLMKTADDTGCGLHKNIQKEMKPVRLAVRKAVQKSLDQK